jgi:hypothetical protein
VVTTSNAQGRTTIFEGFNGTIESEVDSMTDRKVGLLFIRFKELYIAIYDHESFTIWPSSEKLLLADSKNNLIRPPGSAPIKLIRTAKGGLTTMSKAEASKIIRSLVNGQEIKLRYETFPSRDATDRTIQNKAAGFLYTKAASEFRWKMHGQSNLIPKADIFSYFGKSNGELDGYFTANILLNNQIELSRIQKRFNSNIFVKFDFPLRKEVFGFGNGNWLFKPDILTKKIEIAVKDENGKIIYEGSTPDLDHESSMRGYDGLIWGDAENVAKAAWKAGSMGTITLKSRIGNSTSSLYGFRELWQWGIDNHGLPPINE